MRTLLVLLILFFTTFSLQNEGFHKNIDDVAGEFTKDLNENKDLGKLRDELSKKIQETINKFREEHAKIKESKPLVSSDRLEEFNKFLEKVKEEGNKKIEKYEKKKEEKEEKKKEIKEKVKEKLKEKLDAARNKTITRIEEIKKKKENQTQPIVPETRQLAPSLDNEKKKELLEEIFTVVEGFINATKIEQEEKRKRKEELKEELKPVLEKVISEFKTKVEAWKQAKKEEKLQKWEEIKMVLIALKQKAVEKKKEKEEWIRSAWQAIEERVDQLKEQEAKEETGVQPNVKATFLDTLSGTSSWQNVTWILLAICVFLTVALLILILSQNSKRTRYQLLIGTDAAAPSSVYPKLQVEEQQIF